MTLQFFFWLEKQLIKPRESNQIDKIKPDHSKSKSKSKSESESEHPRTNKPSN